MGKVILIGAGPGDPQLITVKAVQQLAKADVVIYDYLANEQLLSYCKPAAEKIYVGKKAGSHSIPQDEINQLLIQKAGENKIVVRLKGGDPFVFGRGGEEVLALVNHGIDFEIVPGITAGVAALTYAGIPTTHRGDATSVSFITGHEDPTKTESGLNWQALANIQGTLVFYMGVRNLPMITQNLLQRGKSGQTPVALIRWGTTSAQQTLTGTLDSIAEQAKKIDFQPPALIVVGDVVRFRDQMNWFERKPLFGKKIVTTRARAQSSELVQQLTELGAEVIEFPTIRIDPPASWELLDRAIQNIQQYDWILFTSVNGVENFFQRIYKSGADARILTNCKIATIGPATAQRLLHYGIQADLQPQEYVAESLIAALKQETKLNQKHFLLPRAEEARAVLKAELEANGVKVDEVVAYRTVVEDQHSDLIYQKILEGQIDLITFTSSSTVKNFVKLVGHDKIANLANTAVACIGPITEKTVIEFGLNCTIMPAEYTISALVQSIINFFAQIKKELS